MNTPRTDAMIQAEGSRDHVTGEPIEVVHADDCRALEIELNDLRLYLERATARVVELHAEQTTLESALTASIARVDFERIKYQDLQRYADAWRKSAEATGQEIVKERESHAVTKATLAEDRRLWNLAVGDAVNGVERAEKAEAENAKLLVQNSELRISLAMVKYVKPYTPEGK